MAAKIKFQWPFRKLFYFDDSVPNRIVYDLPAPAAFTKFFTHNTAFLPNPKGVPHIDWTNWNHVIDKYEERILVWYIYPVDEQVNNKHGSMNPAYPLMFTLCALIDLLTQYMHNLDWHSQKEYQKFLRTNIPEFSGQLSTPIEYTRAGRRGDWKQSRITTTAELFYAGFRCSLLHHGDLAAFCGMSALQPSPTGAPTLLKVISTAGTSSDGVYSYDLHIVDPSVLKDRLVATFKKYCNDLRANPTSQLATNFKARFLQDYGVKI